jgi:hypothetical protein
VSGPNDKRGPQLFRVTFKIVGPLKRSTFSSEAPDPTEELLNDLFHWSSSVRRQIRRLGQDVRDELAAWGSNRKLHARRHFSATSCDEQLLLATAVNLDRALQRVSKKLGRHLYVNKDSRRALWLLRNIYEHWDSLRQHLRDGTKDPEGTLEKLRAEFPQADPWSITIDPDTDDIVIADVVPVRPLIRDLRRLEARVLRLERSRRRGDAVAVSGAPSGDAQ